MKKEIKIYREDLRYFDRFVMENNIDLKLWYIYNYSINLLINIDIIRKK